MKILPKEDVMKLNSQNFVSTYYKMLSCKKTAFSWPFSGGTQKDIVTNLDSSGAKIKKKHPSLIIMLKISVL